MSKTVWDAKFYDKQCSFVSEYGEKVLSLLAPKKNEYILDLGCGTGVLSNEITKLGAHVIGIDSSAEMIEQAKKSYPDIDFRVADGHNFNFEVEFDAVFSNAALHWMLEPERVIACIWRCLKEKGRFVFEMGGDGNLRQLLHALQLAANTFGVADVSLFNYFPKLGEYAVLLEAQGFCVVYAELIDRPTKLPGKAGLRHWVHAFRSAILKQIPNSQHDAFFEKFEEIAQEKLYYDNNWWADYVRLRAVAIKGLS